MGTITIVRTNSGPLRLPDGLIEHYFEAQTDADQQLLNRFVKYLAKMQPGQHLVLTVTKPRSTAFHNRHMKIESTIFNAQERIDNFDRFRDWLKISVGLCQWFADGQGGLISIADSVSYASMDDLKFRDFHSDAMRFFRGDHAATFLWPLLSPKLAYDAMNNLLSEFGE